MFIKFYHEYCRHLFLEFSITLNFYVCKSTGVHHDVKKDKKQESISKALFMRNFYK